MHYLDHLAVKGVGFLHPGGIDFSLFLNSIIPQRDGDIAILEVGCGTAATLVNMALSGKKNLTGVDINKKMILESQKRIKLNNCENNIEVKQIEATGKLPFKDNSFDFIYAESVLAIVDEKILPVLLQEINRCLKNDGKFASNDAIWKPETSAQKINEINKRCVRDFGIVQCIARPAYLNEWKSFFETYFKIEQVFDQEAIKLKKFPVMNNNDAYSSKKRLQFYFSPGLILNAMRYKYRLNKYHKYDGSNIIPYIFLMSKVR